MRMLRLGRIFFKVFTKFYGIMKKIKTQNH